MDVLFDLLDKPYDPYPISLSMFMEHSLHPDMNSSISAVRYTFISFSSKQFGDDTLINLSDTWLSGFLF